MAELSVFVDESGGQNGTSKYCLVTLVLHNQLDSIETLIASYESSLKEKNLPDIPFHASPLMYGKDRYRDIDHETRHRLFSCFFILVRKLPISYKTFAYRRSEVENTNTFIARLKKDLVIFLVDNLAFFQSFEKVKLYYDNGQSMVTSALHSAIEFAISKQAVLYRNASPSDYRLSQVADFLCTMELAAIKYAAHEETSSNVKIFGNAKMFKRNYLRLIRRKELGRQD
ncbi:MAG: DUF3800 domain-containing protein [Eggerthellaceae bacterium]